MTTTIKPVMQTETASWHTEQPVVSLDQQLITQMDSLGQSGLPSEDASVEADNLALCHELLIRQFMMDLAKIEHVQEEE